ncbi:MAG: 1-acyl-sn-glycerol-3-phosphate acyltransferase [Chloracidobacterium sp.]|nr:1-acyl-sn-glycerol-3-phosphate acyltransferase [Chloracidobacterium sp.]
MAEAATDADPPRIVNWLARAITWLVSKPLWFIRFSGLEHIPARGSGAYLIAANHQTYIDPGWIGIPIKHPMRFMAWDAAFEWRFIGPLIAYLGAFPVSLETGGTIRAMKQALRSLRSGAALVVFPEGARETPDGEMLPFKSGVVRIAIQAGVPILPVTIRGGNRIWPRDWKYPRFFRRVTVTYHPLMHVTEDASIEPHENLDRWTARLKKVIESA